ncbi:MAG TPA: bifunctional phosphopantothenoylcysteine decarboxylase/phosphopantothenate--cysteine ligase CoaBC [Polyangiaceae bacterium]|nr:bifunctional phosphopantothenoylcysteine decarboxylase/phosphopantothenate--cysteine ligase CoaBC [Polyangiaceae bacterium]
MSLPTPPPEGSAEPTVPEETSLPSPLFGGAEPSHPGLGLERPIRRRLQGKRIALCVTGSIAAYKSALLLRLLLKEGAEVEVILSRGASEFIGAATFAGLNGKAPFSDMFATPPGGELHVDLAARSDLVLVAPATADVIARLAGGRSDDLITALALCAKCPLLIAPAMHPNMWEHPATQRNVKTLALDARASFVGPVRGEVASGDIGMGRMAEPEVILGFVAAQLTKRTLRRRHVVITAGPTAEDIDPVRTLSNRSSGKMGFAIAERAAMHGAKVTLITGPVALPAPPGVTRVDVRSALAMRGAIWQALHLDLSGADALIMAAAVSDYRPAQAHASKLKRTQEALQLELVPNPDLLAEIGEARRGEMPLLVGFALETDSEDRLVAHAREKLIKKRVDLIVANHADESLGLDDVRARLVTPRDCRDLASMPKEDAADLILDWIATRLREIGR